MTNIVGFFGVMSSGKGVVSTAFLRYCLNKKYRRVISNCWLNLDYYIRLDTNEVYEKLRDDPTFFKNSYLYITELHNIVDSRRSSTIVNTTFTQRITQIGKLNCKIIFDSQLVGQVDVRIREFCPYRVICERFKYVDGKIASIGFWEDRIIKDRIAIKLKLNYTALNGEEKEEKMGYLLPKQKDYDFYKTSEIVTMDREKYLK